MTATRLITQHPPGRSDRRLISTRRVRRLSPRRFCRRSLEALLPPERVLLLLLLLLPDGIQPPPGGAATTATADYDAGRAKVVTQLARSPAYAPTCRSGSGEQLNML